MYELNLTAEEHQRFVRAVKIRMLRKKMSVEDLAKLIRRPAKSVSNYLSDKHPNRFVAADIAVALKIKEKEWKEDVYAKGKAVTNGRVTKQGVSQIRKDGRAQ